MLPERRDLREYLVSTEFAQQDKSVLDKATEGQLKFDISLLPQEPDRYKGIEISDFPDGDKGYLRYRNFQDANISTMDSSIYLPKDQLASTEVTPNKINQKTTSPLYVGGKFAGYTEFEYLYWRKNIGDMLMQQVKAVHLEKSASSVIETIRIDRYVTDSGGDLIYGMIILHSPEVTDKLGMKLDNGDPIFLAFTPNKVLGKTYGPGAEVVAETTYEKLEEAGIKACFTDGHDMATLTVSAGNAFFKLKLGKILKSKYPELLFSTNEELITESGIQAATISSDMLN